MKAPAERIREHLTSLYGVDEAERCWPLLGGRLDTFRLRNPALLASVRSPESRPTERDVLLITYGDQFREPGRAHLATLAEALDKWVGDCIRNVHILPFYPSSSDDGFSVVDYRAVDPALGTWGDVETLARRSRLMCDLVVNHVSRHSRWFQGFLQDESPYNRYFITVDPDTDLSAVVRPRTSPLLTEVQTARGAEHAWTTFSADQVDLNYATPDVLLAMIDVLLFYIEHGARWIRLDAVAYLWKQVGTPCIHLPQTHSVVKLFRAVLDEVAPGVSLISETNVPHAENVSYFGDGLDEAQMVYQFSLPPLVLHAFCVGDTSYLQSWATGLDRPAVGRTFLNFLASHDGIGVRPLEGVLGRGEVARLCALVEARGGHVSYRSGAEGNKSPYELNISYFDALNDPVGGETQTRQIDRFLASQAILLSMAGVPGIYVHSLFGSRNWPQGVAQTGSYRAINREKWSRCELEAELADRGSRRHQVFRRYRELIRTRIREPAFHPASDQAIIDTRPGLFALLRCPGSGAPPMVCIHSVLDVAQALAVDLGHLGFRPGAGLVDLVTGGTYVVGPDGWLKTRVPAYGVLWLREPL